jgi:hypothetical protein
MPNGGRVTVCVLSGVAGAMELLTVTVVAVGFGLSTQVRGSTPFRKSSAAEFVCGKGPAERFVVPSCRIWSCCSEPSPGSKRSGSE